MSLYDQPGQVSDRDFRTEIVFWSATTMWHLASVADSGLVVSAHDVREQVLNGEDVFHWLHLLSPGQFNAQALPEGPVADQIAEWLRTDAQDDTGNMFNVRTNGLLLLVAYIGHNLSRFAVGTR